MLVWIWFWITVWIGCKRLYIPEQWPTEAWERMFLMAEVATQIELENLSVNHFDVVLEAYSNTANELFERIEMIISSVRTGFSDKAVPASWNDRRRDVRPISIVDYCFNNKHGYRPPQEVLEILLQKLSILHYLFEDKKIDPQHIYYPYLMKEFYCIVEDVTELLDVSIRLRIN